MGTPWWLYGIPAVGAASLAWESTRPDVSYTNSKGITTTAAPNKIREAIYRAQGIGPETIADSEVAPELRARTLSERLDPPTTPRETANQLLDIVKQQIKLNEPFTMTKQEQMDFLNAQDEQKRKHAIDLLNRGQGFTKENMGLQYGYNSKLADQAFGHQSKLLGQKHGYDMELGQMQGDYGLVARDMDNAANRNLAQTKIFGDSWNNLQQSIYGMANATSPARALLGVSRYM